jgi:two-component system sensor histidine kinase KdpD
MTEEHTYDQPDTSRDVKDQAADKWLAKVSTSGLGKLKVYIGMSAGVGKSYRMLQEAQTLQRNNVNVKIGYIETHGRVETEELVKGLPVVPRREVFYKGKRLDELDVNTILILHPEWVVVDELAHSNIPGSKNEKRWQDVTDILNAGINVITAVNIQHIESINEEVRKITGIAVQERVPDSFLQQADEVVNIDLTADELITRLKEGKIYDKSKVEQAMRNFFQPEKILQLRELALKEVAGQVERKVETEVARPQQMRHERLLACISSNHVISQKIIRKTARLANYYNSKWFVLYVQTPKEAPDRIALDKQRHLLHNFELATELHAEVIQVISGNVSQVIKDMVEQKGITTVCIGKPHLNLFQIMLRTSTFNQLLKALSENDVDLVILS